MINILPHAVRMAGCCAIFLALNTTEIKWMLTSTHCLHLQACIHLSHTNPTVYCTAPSLPVTRQCDHLHSLILCAAPPPLIPSGPPLPPHHSVRLGQQWLGRQLHFEAQLVGGARGEGALGHAEALHWGGAEGGEGGRGEGGGQREGGGMEWPD